MLVLTRRQRQVVELVANGKLAKEISGDLSVGVQVVKDHLMRARRANNCRTTGQLVAMWAEDEAWQRAMRMMAGVATPQSGESEEGSSA